MLDKFTERPECIKCDGVGWMTYQPENGKHKGWHQVKCSR